MRCWYPSLKNRSLQRETPSRGGTTSTHTKQELLRLRGAIPVRCTADCGPVSKLGLVHGGRNGARYARAGSIHVSSARQAARSASSALARARTASASCGLAAAR